MGHDSPRLARVPAFPRLSGGQTVVSCPACAPWSHTLLGLGDPPTPSPPFPTPAPASGERPQPGAKRSAAGSADLGGWGWGTRRKRGHAGSDRRSTLKNPETPGPAPSGLLFPCRPRTPEVSTFGEREELEGLRRERERDICSPAGP